MTLPIGVLLDVAGGGVIASQLFYRVGAKPVVRLGDAVTPHGDAPHDAPIMAQSSPWYRVNNIPACKETDLASCGDLLVSTQPWHRIS